MLCVNAAVMCDTVNMSYYININGYHLVELAISVLTS